MAKRTFIEFERAYLRIRDRFDEAAKRSVYASDAITQAWAEVTDQTWTDALHDLQRPYVAGQE